MPTLIEALDDRGMMPATAAIEAGKLYRETLKKFMETKIRENLNYKYELGYLGTGMTELRKKNQQLKLETLHKRAAEHQNNWVFITISPKEGVPFLKFKEKCIKFAQRQMFLESYLVFEQRGSTMDEVGKGFHAHVECRRNVEYKPSQIIRNTQNSFKNIVNLKVPQTLTIQHHGNEFHSDKMEYITGIKTGKLKDVKQAMDIIFRKKFNIDICYNYAST